MAKATGLSEPSRQGAQPGSLLSRIQRVSKMGGPDRPPAPGVGLPWRHRLWPGCLASCGLPKGGSHRADHTPDTPDVSRVHRLAAAILPVHLSSQVFGGGLTSSVGARRGWRSVGLGVGPRRQLARRHRDPCVACSVGACVGCRGSVGACVRCRARRRGSVPSVGHSVGPDTRSRGATRPFL